MLKPKNGYFKEPKDKWNGYKVYAAVKKQLEPLSNGMILNNFDRKKILPHHFRREKF